MCPAGRHCWLHVIEMGDGADGTWEMQITVREEVGEKVPMRNKMNCEGRGNNANAASLSQPRLSIHIETIPIGRGWELGGISDGPPLRS